MGVGSWVRSLRERSPNSTAEGSKQRFRRGSRPPNDLFLTPAEQIVAILARHDGQMRQAEIVAAMDYSESSVSRRLCEMESAGAVARYRIGREKHVFLPEAVPAWFKSSLNR